MTFSKQTAGLEKKFYSMEWPANKDEREDRPTITESWMGTKLGPQTCFVLNFAQNLRECSINLAGSESGEKSKRTQFFV